jgi:hypothetical protein
VACEPVEVSLEVRLPGLLTTCIVAGRAREHIGAADTLPCGFLDRP